MSAGIGSAPPHPLLASSPGLRRRHFVNRAMEVGSTVAAVVAVAVLGIVIVSVVIKGASAINLDFFIHNEALFGQPGGGIANAIVGTVLLVAMATIVAVPVGILVGIFTAEFVGPKTSGIVRFCLDILNGVPTIVTGIFIFGLLVVGHHQSAIAGALALAIIMLPIVARSSHEVLALVPESLKEGALALGMARWRVVLRIIVPTAASGLITGALLAVARVAGETAPLLFTCSIAENAIATNITQPVSSIPFKIFTLSEGTSPAEHAQAWAAALLLIVFVLLLNIIARTLYARASRKMGVAR
jgi:phosphate transport system permease protein